MPELLLELMSEEIPSRMQAQGAEDLRRLMLKSFDDAGLTYGEARTHAGPRRLALSVADVARQTPSLSLTRKGPRLDAGDKAIAGFLSSVGLTREQCDIAEDKKGRFYLAHIEKPGFPAPEIIARTVQEVIGKFPWPKSMRWGRGSLRWVRPLHGILCCYDGVTVAFSLGDLKAGDTTYGHRFMSPGPVVARNFAAYERELRRAKVMVDARAREDAIAVRLKELAGEQGLRVIEDPALLRETAGLVEWPVVLEGRFSPDFLSLPPAVIITAIKAHQKCFCALYDRGDKTGQLADSYFLVANLAAADGGRSIIEGNNRVVAARLADARFFWRQDRDIPLGKWREALRQVSFHAKLGNQWQRTERLARLAQPIASYIGADVAHVTLAAQLCKADLVTGMVKEFPELQGCMGRYYAQDEGLPAPVSEAIGEHYKPQGPNDATPEHPVSQAVALADKLDMLAGFWFIGEPPTGSRDPYALRRAALGVIRIILDGGLRLPLKPLMQTAVAAFARANDAQPQNRPSNDKLVDDLMDFLLERLNVYLRGQGLRYDAIEAVFAADRERHQGQKGRDDLVMIVKRIKAIAAFAETPAGEAFLASFKRVANILTIERKEFSATKSQAMGVNPALLCEKAERTLHEAVTAASQSVSAALAQDDPAGALDRLGDLSEPIAAFFDTVTVNAEDCGLRENRLYLLDGLRDVVCMVADFSRLAGADQSPASCRPSLH